MDNERSLSSGLSIPQWMKSKMIDNRLDLDQGAFSPPGHDDSFLYIQYPRKKSRDERNAAANFIKEAPDASRHTPPCRPFINGATPTPSPKQLKSNGTDDGFKGKAAACGTSIVKVAHQMVSERTQQQQELVVEQDSFLDIPIGFDPAIRRGSRSLPASPLGSPSSSPKTQRKLISTQNKYFTAAFSDDRNGSWILSSLLGKRQVLSRSVSTVSEEAGSVTDLSAEEAPERIIADKKAPIQVFKARPSELREMNFWSPTSM